MALDGLLAAIARDGDAESERVLEAARSEAARLRADAEARAERHCAEVVRAREAEMRVGWELRRARTLTRTRADVLRARERFLERVFGVAESALIGFFDQPEAAPAFEHLVAEALDYFCGTGVTVRCRAGLAARLATPAPTLGSVRVVADDAVSEGVVIEAADGSARIDNTLVSRLQRMRPSLSIDLLAAVKEAT